MVFKWAAALLTLEQVTLTNLMNAALAIVQTNLTTRGKISNIFSKIKDSLGL